MDQIKPIYDALNHVENNLLFKAIRLGRADLIEKLSPVLDTPTAHQVLQYGRKLAASKMTEPYGLGEYICYKYYGSTEDFAKSQDITVEHLEQAIYSGHYWHNDAIHALVPVTIRRKPVGGNIITTVPPVADFIGTELIFGEGNTHVTDLWMAYVLTPNMTSMSRTGFGKALEHELSKRGYNKTTSLRIGNKVSTGYKGISVKTV